MRCKILVVFLLWLLGATQALAEARIALIIGNGDYHSVGKLPNPPNDAKLMAKTLSAIGFEVTLVSEGSFSDMRSAISAFGARLRESGKDTTGLFYYAGHGVQSFGRNYLLPVDATLTNAADISLVAIEADSVLQQMRSAGNTTNIVILDACRNNPFKKVLDLGDNGLAEMNAPAGTFLAYATGPGQTAADGTGSDSPFTLALASEIQKPGQSLEEVFKEVRRTVRKDTGNMQTPWDTSSLSADFFFVPVKALSSEEQAEQQLWDALATSNDPMQISLFLKAYPDSAHSGEARALLKTLLEAMVSPDPTPGKSTASPETPAPSAEEMAAFDEARLAGTREAYEAFIKQFPASVLVEAANQEIVVLPKSEPVASADKGLSVVPDVAVEPDDPAAYDNLSVAFDTPLVVGPAELVGHTLDELISEGTPLYPPFEGLPDEVWKGQKCTSCHQWTRDILCDQAKVLLGLSGETAQRSLAIKHPLGTPFKLTLRAWAKGGCG
ncbi:MAG: caspase family protein [bacterium]